MKPKESTAYLPVRVSPKTADMIKRISMAQDQPQSKIIRDLLEAGLQAKGYVSGSESQTEQIQTAVQTVMQPHVDRLAAISAKAAHISAAAFFLMYADVQMQTPASMQAELEDVAAKARKLGVEYLKLNKDKNVDSFILRGLRSMTEPSE